MEGFTEGINIGSEYGRIRMVVREKYKCQFCDYKSTVKGTLTCLDTYSPYMRVKHINVNIVKRNTQIEIV